MTFVRASDGQRHTFDSSPQYSLSKLFGWYANTIQLTLETEDARRRTYSVRGSSTEDGEPVHVGTLFQKTRAEIRRELSTR